MTRHCKIYMDYFDLGIEDIITCELCTRQGRIDRGGYDIHHINGRGKGKDVISNLMLLCRDCHSDVHNGKIKKEVLKLKHEKLCQK